MISDNGLDAYVLLVNDDNSITTTHKRRIMQRSKLVDNLWFLVGTTYNAYDMSEFTVLLEYIKPTSKKYKTEILTLSDERYNNYLKYSLPIDTEITDEAGDVLLQLSFLMAELDEDGAAVQRVRKTAESSIHITPISAWSDIIPDSALTSLDQRIIKIDAQIKALNETGEFINQNKADNIAYDRDTNEFQLTAAGRPIGQKVTLKSGETDPDGTIVVDFSNYAGDSDDEESSSDENDVVEF